jgi:hypothetical protein
MYNNPYESQIPDESSEIEIKEAGDLPEIPEDFMRLTHVTSNEVAEKIMREDFEPERNIGETTDPFSKNEQLYEFLSSKTAGRVFDRDYFGDTVVVIDLPCGAHKKMLRGYVPEKKVPNSNILGVIRWDEGLSLVTNPDYEPRDFEVETVKIAGPARSESTGSVEVPGIPGESDELGREELW